MLALLAAIAVVALPATPQKSQADKSIMFDGFGPTGSLDDVIVCRGSLIGPKAARLTFFSEPFETVIFIFGNLEWMTFSTGDDRIINAPVSWMVERIMAAGYEMSDITHCVHNHFSPVGFTVGDINVYRYLKRSGFRGVFGIYYTATGEFSAIKERI